jgi:hypothetical protein
MVYYGASRKCLETRFWGNLADDGDTPDSVRRKIDLLLHPFDMSSCDGLGDDQLSICSDPDSHLSLLTPEQHSIASKIIKAVLHETHQLMFIQGSAGTGETLIVKALINTLQSHRKKCLICGTTGIAAVQHPGGTTLRFLFRLGIDEESRGGFRSNIGLGTPLARYILPADLIIIDEVSMLTPWVANRVSLTLQSISAYERIQFDGKRILFAGDLLQLPPLFRIFQCSSRIAHNTSPVLELDSRISNPTANDSFRSVVGCLLALNGKGKINEFRIGGNSRAAFICLSPRRLALFTISSVTG